MLLVKISVQKAWHRFIFLFFFFLFFILSAPKWYYLYQPLDIKELYYHTKPASYGTSRWRVAKLLRTSTSFLNIYPASWKTTIFCAIHIKVSWLTAIKKKRNFNFFSCYLSKHYLLVFNKRHNCLFNLNGPFPTYTWQYITV